MKKRFIGISEYKRNSLYGSIFVIGISIPLSQIQFLRELRLQNCRKASFSLMDDIATKIIENYDFEVEEIQPTNIIEHDLDRVETIAYAKCFRQLKVTNRDRIFVKNFMPSKNEFISIMNKIGYENTQNWKILKRVSCKCLPCFTASLLAEYYYKFYLNEFRKENGHIGSGNLTDKTTQKFIKTVRSRVPDFVRVNSQMFNPFRKYLTM